MTVRVQWGLSDLVPEDAVAAWGARAILRNYVLDMPPDRMNAAFEDDTSKQVFLMWLNTRCAKWLEAVARQARGDEAELFSFDDGPFHMRANTNKSYGYLYVTAWMDRVTTSSSPSPTL